MSDSKSIPCPACGHPITAKSVFCPKCGFVSAQRAAITTIQVWAWLLGIVVLVLAPIAILVTFIRVLGSSG
jgi:predicted nucleic acid-binding Zn ribbon protein